MHKNDVSATKINNMCIYNNKTINTTKRTKKNWTDFFKSHMECFYTKKQKYITDKCDLLLITNITEPDFF